MLRVDPVVYLFSVRRSEIPFKPLDLMLCLSDSNVPWIVSGSRIRAPSSETGEVQVVPYHYGASHLHTQCLKDSLLNIHYAEEGTSGLTEGTGDDQAVCACRPVHAGRGRNMMYLESFESFYYTKLLKGDDKDELVRALSPIRGPAILRQYRLEANIQYSTRRSRMHSQVLWRSLRVARTFIKGQNYSTGATSSMSSGKQNPSNQPHRPRGQRRQRQPALTHFLCLPLVNHVSLPQLEASIAAFTTAHPPVPVADPSSSQQQTTEQDALHPAIPQGAVRPVGTIHLTIGVMSLPTKERLDEALAFFQTLDLASLLREAERVAYEVRQKRALKRGPNTADASSFSSTPSLDSEPAHRPLSVSLESLHALPRAKAATVLHASPVDPTGRLYPFCVMLRDKFIEAGFMLSEAKNGVPPAKSDPKAVEEVQASQCKDLNSDDNPLLEEMPNVEPEAGNIRAPKVLGPFTAALARKPRPRPLLLHATLVNTIYVRGRRKFEAGGNGRNGRNGSRRLEFDARELLARYRNYYADETQTTPRDDARSHSESSTESSSSSELGGAEGEEVTFNPVTSSAASRPQYPFVWARDIPINSVTICEMGAKTLEVGGPEDRGLNARLGEEYTIIAERSLDSCSQSVPSSPGRASEESLDGGVDLA